MPAGQTPRSSNGRYLPSPDTPTRIQHALDMRRDGATYRQIAAALDVDVKTAHTWVTDTLKATVKESAQQLLTLELERLDAELERLNTLEDAARAVLERQHVTVSHGHIVCDESDEPLPDDGPVLQAIDRLVRIEDARRRNGERRAKLLGLDAEKKVNVSGGVRYEVVGIDPADHT